MDLSLLKVMRLTLSVCTFLRATSLHVSASYFTTSPESKPAIMCWSAMVHPIAVALSISSTLIVSAGRWMGALSSFLPGMGVPYSSRSSGWGNRNMLIVPRSREVKGSAAVQKFSDPSPHFTARTTPLCGIRAMYFPVVVSNRRAMASAQAVTTYLESQLGSMSHTAPPWGPYVPRRSPESEYQHVGLWSFAAVKIKSPSLLYLTVVIDRSCPFSRIG
mmetsp:Transcript_21518/g.47861  ORF Transcript_21518/g.47861 Transcript_21518/m.47861 type:complete len:218 (+) Transcript_21518:2509-3162(+)